MDAFTHSISRENLSGRVFKSRYSRIIRSTSLQNTGFLRVMWSTACGMVWRTASPNVLLDHGVSFCSNLYCIARSQNGPLESYLHLTSMQFIPSAECQRSYC